MSHRLRVALAAALFAVCSAVGADEVTLRSADGGLEIAGEVIAYDGEYIRLGTDYGPVTVGADAVTCEGAGCPDAADLVARVTFAGAAVMADRLLPALIERFALSEAYGLSRIERTGQPVAYELRRGGALRAVFHIAGSTTDGGYDALINREADVALALRPPLGLEIAAGRAAGQGNLAEPRRGRILALDGLVPLVSADNPAPALSLADLARIFSGGIADWAALGGPAGPIALHLPMADSGLAQFFTDRVMVAEGRDYAPGITRHATPEALADAVARDPLAIGIGTYSEVGTARAVPLRGRCGFTQAATDIALKAEDYPLTTPLYLILPPHRMAQPVRDFLAFLETREAERVVRRSGFVSQGIEEVGLEAQGARLANAIAAAGTEVTLRDLQQMIAGLRGTRRLTPTFRFENGRTTLDVPSFDAARRLARMIELGRYDGRELIFVGFSDGEGLAEANRRLARERAQAVRDAVALAAPAADLDRLTLRVAAYGEALPMACDDTAWGRQVNRRVEVWLR